jgi:putative ABC transport system ATP-binding protein
MTPTISLRAVTKVFASGPAEIHALTGVNIDIWPGEVALLMGPSGSGKTTLLSIMGCLLQPTTGTVRIHDVAVSGLNEEALPDVRLKYIGFVFQDCNLFKSLTAGENVQIALELKGVHGRNARNKADELLNRAGLPGKSTAYPKDLSGGQKQRVAIARALAGDPKIILADEPTSALDSRSGRSILELLSSLAWELGHSVVVVTHDSQLIEYADHVFQVKDGRLSEEYGYQQNPSVRRRHAAAGHGAGEGMALDPNELGDGCSRRASGWRS